MVMQINPNGKGLVGLNSQIDTASIINKVVEIESKKTEPVQLNINKKQLEKDTWSKVNELMEAVKAKSDPISKFMTWDNKIATSSDPNILTAEAGRKAETGRTNVVVDKIALNHQIASSLIPSEAAHIGTGIVKIRIGDREFQEVEIGEESSTAKALVETINESKLGIEATIVQIDDTGEKFQIVLTSTEKGWKGRMAVEFELSGGEFYPDFKNINTQPDKWIYKNRNFVDPLDLDVSNSSTAIPLFSGSYYGEEDIEIKFKPINSGTVGAENQLLIEWEDNLGRSGSLDLSSFNYHPGKFIAVTDGIEVSFSRGTVLEDEFFTMKAKPDESGLWYVAEEDEPSIIYKPSGWRTSEEGMSPPTLSGKYVGDDDTYTLTVIKGGVVGSSDRVVVKYESEDGEEGVLLLGVGYKPGSTVKLGDSGLKISFPEGILVDGAQSDFDVEEGVDGFFWWINNGYHLNSEFTDPTHWYFPEGVQEALDVDPDKVKDRTVERSNVLPEVEGYFTGNKNKEYKVTVEGNGTVGESPFLNLYWEDEEGNTGRLDVGSSYSAGDFLEFDEGLKMAVPDGELYDGDYFHLKGMSTVIQPAQDAVIRVNATAEGGGLVMRSGNNIFEEAIQGVKLETIKSSPDVVVIDIQNDLDTPKEAVKEFVLAYNELLSMLKEAAKYDVETGEAGPLQASGKVVLMQDLLSEIIIDPVAGLERTHNNSTYAGLSYNKDGLLDFDEQKFDTKATEDIKKVAHIFTTAGHIDGKGVEVISATEKTRTTAGKVDLDITQMPEQGIYNSAPLGDFVRIDENNDIYKISIDGRESENIFLPHGIYTRNHFVEILERHMKMDKALEKVEFDLILNEDILSIVSPTFGSSSKITVTNELEITEDNEDFALFAGTSIDGRDVKATLDNEELEGTGRSLRGKFDTRFEGLRMMIYPEEIEFDPERVEYKFSLTKGIGARSYKYSFEETEYKDEGLPKIISDTGELVKKGKERLGRLNDTLERKKDRLVRQFSTMETNLSKFKQQETALKGQLASLSSAGG